MVVWLGGYFKARKVSRNAISDAYYSLNPYYVCGPVLIFYAKKTGLTTYAGI